ncbi:MAG: TonB-dependent receptor [Pseudomonadota bacterium]
MNRKSDGRLSDAALGVGLVLLFSNCIALAQDVALEVVLVTAQKRTESLQDVPVAVNAFSADTIQEAEIHNATDLALVTPSLSVTRNSTAFNTRFAIRGIGTAQNDPALEPSVGLFFDGVFLGRSGLGMSDLSDVERIEVLQGPQGTLYGKNSNAGAISVITKRPNLEGYEGYVEATMGNYDLLRTTLAVSGPMTETLGFRLAGNLHQRDGFMKNSGGNDLNDVDDWNVQGKLLWEPSDRLGLLLSGIHVERSNSCCAPDSTQVQAVQDELAAQGFERDKNDPYDYRIATSRDTEFELDSDVLSLQIDYEADWGTLTSITAWSDYAYSEFSDPDRSQLRLVDIINEQSSGDSLSQELRLDASPSESFDYLLGLFYYEQETQRGESDSAIPLPADRVVLGEDFLTIAPQVDSSLPWLAIARPGDYLFGKNVWNNETFAVFGQLTWHLGDQWGVTGGLRWTDEERKADLLAGNVSSAPLAPDVTFWSFVSTPVDASLHRTSKNVDWLLKVAFHARDDIMVYVSAATGTKSGNFNGVNGLADEREFDDENTLSYELGLKSTLLDSRLRLNAAAFYTEIDDYQSQQQLATGIGTRVGNEAEVEVSGVDLQLDAVPLENLTLTAGLLYMHKYEIMPADSEPFDLPFTADYTGNLAATLVFPVVGGMLYLRADYMHMGNHATSAQDAELLGREDFDDRTLVNAKLGWRNNHWNVSIWGKNLTQDKYARLTTNPTIYSGQESYFLAEPFTYGANIRYTF